MCLPLSLCLPPTWGMGVSSTRPPAFFPKGHRGGKKGEGSTPTNLTPHTLSLSNLSSSPSTALRLEPQYMIIGQSAGVALAMAFKGKTAVQDVPIKDLQDRLRALGQKIDL